MGIVKTGDGGLTCVPGGGGFPNVMQGRGFNYDSSSGGNFVPADLGNLDFDLDPFVGVTKDGSNKVSQIIEQVTGTEAYVASAGNEPTWVENALNGTRPVIRSGLDTWLQNNTQVITNRDLPHTVVSVFKPNTQVFGVISVLKANTGEGLLTMVSNFAGVEKIQQGSNSFAYGRTPNLPPTLFNQWHVLYQIYNGNGSNTLSNHTFYVDGATEALDTSFNIGAGNTKSVIGAWNTLGFGQNFDGDWGRILKYGKVLTAGEMAQLNAYILSTYGV